MSFNFKRLFAAAVFMAASQASTATELKVEHVANAGIKISSGGKTILIDALFGPHSHFNFLTDNEFKTLTDEGADVALATHAHADHYGADRAAAFLNGSPNTLFIGTPRMHTTLKGKAKAEQVATTELSEFGSKTFSHRSVKVEVLNFPHMMPREGTPVNYGYVVEVNGWKVLHVGDANVSMEMVKGLKLADKKIDMAVLHDLFPVRQENYAAILKQIGAKKVAFMHMTDDKAEPLKKWMAESMPDGEMLVTGYENVVMTR